ncbi:MAG: hypothetical protein WC823_00690 [Parcubacteria group bacterium]|jgi:hypothetical protein
MKKISFTKKELQVVFEKDFSPEKLLQFLVADFGEIYVADAGVWEGYTIGQHTLMVLRQFERYFGAQPLPGNFDIGMFRLILALHDTGKQEAIARGDKNQQHRYTVQIIEAFFDTLDFPEASKKLAVALIEEDAIGKYIRGKNDVFRTAGLIEQAAAKGGMFVQDFLELLIIFYRVDAGSYTEDAGGFKSLDHLFAFDHKKPALAFAPEIAIKMEILQKHIM